MDSVDVLPAANPPAANPPAAAAIEAMETIDSADVLPVVEPPAAAAIETMEAIDSPALGSLAAAAAPQQDASTSIVCGAQLPQGNAPSTAAAAALAPESGVGGNEACAQDGAKAGHAELDAAQVYGGEGVVGEEARCAKRARTDGPVTAAAAVAAMAAAPAPGEQHSGAILPPCKLCLHQNIFGRVTLV